MGYKVPQHIHNIDNETVSFSTVILKPNRGSTEVSYTCPSIMRWRLLEGFCPGSVGDWRLVLLYCSPTHSQRDTFYSTLHSSWFVPKTLQLPPPEHCQRQAVENGRPVQQLEGRWWGPVGPRQQPGAGGEAAAAGLLALPSLLGQTAHSSG